MSKNDHNGFLNDIYSKAEKITVNGRNEQRQPERPAVRRRSGIPLWGIIAAAVVGLAVIIFALYLFVFSGNTQAAVIASPSPIVTVEPTQAPSPNTAPTPTIEPTPATSPTPIPIPQTAWGANFPGKFTSGDIEKTDTSYKSAHVNVSVQTVQKEGVTYLVADIYITDLKYFKAPFSDGVFSKNGGSGTRNFVEKIAQDNNAILAIDGDFYTENPGPVLRDGVLYRNEVMLDILVMLKDGTMKTYSKGEYDKDTIEQLKDNAWQIWTFGPMLLKDGEPMTKFNLPKPIGALNPRMAIGYYEPGHYCFVAVDGRRPGYSKGITMTGLSQLMHDLGCKVAFNLDGGGSAQMAFMGNEINKPCSNRRKDRDALCIIDDAASDNTAASN